MSSIQALPREGLFDPDIYETPELRLPKVDGSSTDRIALKFTGTVFLDRRDPADVALMREMALGSDVSLTVEGRCTKKGYGYASDSQGDLEAVKLEHAVTIHTVYKP